MAAAELSIEGISKRFGETTVLTDVSLRIAAGEFVSLLGPSGCGKSTLLRIVAGLEQQDQGSIFAAGRALDPIAPKDRDLAFVFQSYALYPHLSVRDNIATPLLMRELSALQRLPLLGRRFPGSARVRAGIEKRVADVSSLLKLDALLDRRPQALSGGQRQRVALGRALVRRPRIFLMDEPLANLDAGLRIHTRGEIARLHREMNTTTLFVTHDQAEATALSDRVAVMFGGEIRQLATPIELYSNPVDLDVARFITQPFLNTLTAGTPVGGVLDVGSTRIHLRDAEGSSVPGPGTVAFRPEHAVLGDHGTPGTIPAVALRVEHAGTDAHVFLRATTGEELVVRTSTERAAGILPGQSFGLSIDAERAWFFPRDGARGRRCSGGRT